MAVHRFLRNRRVETTPLAAKASAISAPVLRGQGAVHFCAGPARRGGSRALKPAIAGENSVLLEKSVFPYPGITQHSRDVPRTQLTRYAAFAYRSAMHNNRQHVKHAARARALRGPGP